MSLIENIYPGAILSLSSHLSNIKNPKIFLVRGKESFTKSGAKNKLNKILSNYDIEEFYDFDVNPRLEDVRMGLNKFVESNANVIISVGGGSTIDMAKLIRHFFYKRASNVLQKYIPLICIPTTAGTGSEATNFAVMYIRNIKYSINLSLPNYAIVDSELLEGQNPYQMAVSGLDAFCQGVESLWSINSTKESSEYSEEAIKLLWNFLEKAINKDEVAKEKISLGAFLSGKAINITKTTAPHAFSYYYTSHKGIPHGHAVAMFMPYFISYNKKTLEKDCMDPRGVEFVRKKINRISEILSISESDVELKIISFFKKCGVNIDFNILSIDRKTFTEGLNYVNNERLKNNPRYVDRSVINEIFDYNQKMSDKI